MSKLSKRMQMICEKVDKNKQYNICEAITFLKKQTSANFIESVDVAVNLGIDVHKSDQIIRGTVILPNGTGRLIRVAVFTQGQNIELAKAAGAEMVGMEDLAEKIKNGRIDFNIVIASPEAMHIVNQLGQILGPRGMMPSQKTGTITQDITAAIKKAKSGQICYRNDKNGIIHTTIGKIDFESSKLKENLKVLLIALKKAKPSQTRGIYIKKVSISTTMGIGIKIDYTALIDKNINLIY